MENTEIILDKNIKGQIKETIVLLLRQQHRALNIDLGRIRVGFKKRNIVCPGCGHECVDTSYRTHYNLGHVIVSYTSCDCGYTYILNIGGWGFKWEPGTEPYIWKNHNGAGPKPVCITEEHARDIIESGLVCCMEE